MRLFRAIFSMLLVVAYLSATVIAVAPVANAAPHAMADMMMKADGMGDKTMPCKSMKPGCVTELGCIFMLSLPAPNLGVSSLLVWSPISYSIAAEYLEGRSTKPALGPPRSLT